MRNDNLNRLLSGVRQAGIWRIAFLFLLLSWAILSYSTGDKFLAALILVFVALVVLRVPYIVPVAVLGIVLVLFNPPLMKTGEEILQSHRSILENPGLALSNLFTPASGQAGLPPQARRALSLLEAHGVDRYRLSSQILDDPLISQRITEMAWPRRIDESSPYLILFLDEEKEYPGCTLIDQKKDVALEHCD
jgi:hypothetical protein